MLGNVKERSKNQDYLITPNQMNSVTRVTTIGIPAIIGIGLAWAGNRISRKEKELKDRELELKLQLEKKPFKIFK